MNVIWKWREGIKFSSSPGSHCEEEAMWSRYRGLVEEGADRFVLLVRFLCTINIVTTHVCYTSQVLGPSMLPTADIQGDLFLVELISQKMKKIKKGDVVMSRSPEAPRKLVCKRVLGLEGDQIVIQPREIGGRVQHVVVPKGHVWLQGDNTNYSVDSRMYGPVPYALLQGKVCYRRNRTGRLS